MERETQKLRKMFTFGTVLMLCLVLLTACSNRQEKLSDNFDQDKIQEATTRVIDAVNAKDNGALREISGDTMRSALTDDTPTVVYKAIDEDGAFQEIKGINIAGTSDEDTKEDYAVAVAGTQYGEKVFIYTIFLTKNVKLAGLYYK